MLIYLCFGTCGKISDWLYKYESNSVAVRCFNMHIIQCRFFNTFWHAENLQIYKLLMISKIPIAFLFLN